MEDGIEKLNPINPGEPIRITDSTQGRKKGQRHNPKAHGEFDSLLHRKELEMAGNEEPKPAKKAKYKNGKRIV